MKQKPGNMFYIPRRFFPALIMGLMLRGICTVQGDVVYLKDGGSVEGKLTRQGDKLRVEFGSGSIELSQDDVERVETRALPQQIFADQLSKVGDDADACVKLAQWALAKNLTQEYILGLRRALPKPASSPWRPSTRRFFSVRTTRCSTTRAFRVCPSCSSWTVLESSGVTARRITASSMSRSFGIFLGSCSWRPRTRLI